MSLIDKKLNDHRSEVHLSQNSANKCFSIYGGSERIMVQSGISLSWILCWLQLFPLLLSTTCNVKTLPNVPWVDMVSIYNSTWTSLYPFSANRWDLPWCADHSQLWQFSPQIVLIRRRTVGSCPRCYSGLMCSCIIMVSRESLLPMSSTRTKPTSEQQILCVSPLLSRVLHIAEVPLIELLWCNRGNFLSLRKLNCGDILFMI